MKQKLATVEECMDKCSILSDITKYHILPQVKMNEEQRNEDAIKLNNSVFTIFFPKASNIALIIRYNPRSKNNDGETVMRSCHMLTWNLETNEIIPGQWLLNKKIKITQFDHKGNLEGLYSDLSPDGKYFVYNLCHPKAKYSQTDKNNKPIYEYLTVICKPLYFSGLHVTRYTGDSKYYDSDYYKKRMHGASWIVTNNPNEYCIRFVNEEQEVIRSVSPINKLPPNIKIHKLEELDVKARTLELGKLTVVQLKELLSNQGLSKNGLKNDMITRLVKNEQNETILEQKSFKNAGSTICRLPCQDPRGRSIKIEDGFLMVDGKKIHDFTNDRFKEVAPPKDYDW